MASGITFTFYKTSLGKHVKDVVFWVFFFLNNVTLLNPLLLLCCWYNISLRL